VIPQCRPPAPGLAVCIARASECPHGDSNPGLGALESLGWKKHRCTAGQLARLAGTGGKPSVPQVRHDLAIQRTGGPHRGRPLEDVIAGANSGGPFCRGDGVYLAPMECLRRPSSECHGTAPGSSIDPGGRPLRADCVARPPGLKPKWGCPYLCVWAGPARGDWIDGSRESAIVERRRRKEPENRTLSDPSGTTAGRCRDPANKSLGGNSCCRGPMATQTF
jgi:hypothetical protein